MNHKFHIDKCNISHSVKSEYRYRIQILSTSLQTTQ